jgi:hypothetical protein
MSTTDTPKAPATPRAVPTTPPLGGVHVEWIVSQPAREYTSKADGATRTVVELRDPSRLGNSITLFLDGPAGDLAKVAANATVRLRLEEVRPGRGRGELVGSANREDVDAAFARAF